MPRPVDNFDYFIEIERLEAAADRVQAMWRAVESCRDAFGLAWDPIQHIVRHMLDPHRIFKIYDGVVYECLGRYYIDYNPYAIQELWGRGASVIGDRIISGGNVLAVRLPDVGLAYSLPPTWEDSHIAGADILLHRVAAQ